MQRKTIVIFLLGFVVCDLGCMTTAKRMFKEGKGASSNTDVVPGTGGASFAQFAGVEVLPPQSDLGGLVGSAFNSELVSALQEELVNQDDAPFKGGAPVLSIEPHVQWYHKGGGVFPDKYAIVLFFLKGEGVDMGHILITTKSEASRTGDRALAESTAEELRSYFEKHGKRRRPKESDEASDS